MTQAFIAAFTGTAIEFFETLVIAYAIVRAGYAREAWSAVVLGHALVFAFAVVLFPLRDALPLQWLRLVAALLLTAMGLHWTQKSLRRLLAGRRPRWAQDPLGKLSIAPAAGGGAAAPFSWWVFIVMAKSSLVEAGEILIVVFPIAAATAAIGPVIAGVVAGIAAVCLPALLLHRRLHSVPEVKLKLAVGLLLSALGLSWLFELHDEGGLPALPWN